MRVIQSLNGLWNYRIGKGEWCSKQVPFSVLPVGHSECERSFDLEQRGDRVLLKFDGITYQGTVTLNGKQLGVMLPYSEYVFDVTDIAREKGNKLLVELEDISPAFGPTAGWENFGGIIRDVELVYTEKTYIDDVFFHSNLKNDYADAEYTVELTANEAFSGEWRVTLSYGGEKVDSYTLAGGEKAAVRAISGVRLWSPDSPELYTLQVELCVDGRVVDSYECQVGFREFSCDRHRFLLNGRPVFLQGVCKHEMYEESGHTVTAEQIEQDLRLIKDTGCNFVRLVHYPHNKKTLEIADRLGLMVSEEPGLWWSDTSDPQVSAGSLEVLRRVIHRDRNHASIVFWLCFNECEFTEQFLIDSAKVCRENDPTRLVSGANCMTNEDTLKYYNICEFDFYTMHPYSDTFERSLESAKVLHDKPLMFTEWGGYFVYDNPHLLTDFIDGMYGLYKQNSDEGALAGASFWFWAELNDFSRGRPACVDGVLTEALVDSHRQPTLIYQAFCDGWKNAAAKADDDRTLYEYTALQSIDKTALKCGQVGDEKQLLEYANVNIPAPMLRMRGRNVTVGPVLQREEVKGLLTTPAVVSDGQSLLFEGSGVADEVTLLGLTSLPKGYPITSDYGEDAAEVVVELASGESERFVLKNGVDITTAFTTLASSRIEPYAEKATRFARFSYEKNHENYIINRLDLKLSRKAEVKAVRVNSLGNGYNILFYGVFI